MAPTFDAETEARFRAANGGARSGVRPQPPNGPYTKSWRVGDPAHWMEQSSGERTRCILLRFIVVLQVAASATYLQYRARHTLGVYPQSREPGWFTLQILFFCYEVLVSVFPLCHALEVWNVTHRNSVDFKRIPNSMIRPKNNRPNNLSTKYSNYPTISVIIPCYREDTAMVLSVVRAACRMDYPQQLIQVYLCDDGKDPEKQAGMARLAKTYPNTHYVARPDNLHAKPGNVNYTLERTDSDLIVQFDADFIARPNLVQRLLSYYYVYNEAAGLYEFNDGVGFVQTPQHYRNLSPHDVDMFDQRNILFFTHVLPGKDWNNSATMVGTSNLINRTALNEAGNFPYHTKGDDTGLSLMLHGLGFTSYYVNESVATGLVPPSLRGNLSQRSRWYMSDFEILFSRHGPLTQRGLSLSQRLIYINVIVFRFMNVLGLFFDVLLILVLTAGFLIVDVQNPVTFLLYLIPHILAPYVYRIAESVGKPGVYKSIAANELFESMFRYYTLKGMLMSLFKAGGKKWKTAEKVTTIPEMRRPSNVKGKAKESGKAKEKGQEKEKQLPASHVDESSNQNQDEQQDQTGDVLVEVNITEDENVPRVAELSSNGPENNDLNGYEDDEDDDDDDLHVRVGVNGEGDVEAGDGDGRETNGTSGDDRSATLGMTTTTHTESSASSSSAHASAPARAVRRLRPGGYTAFILRNLRRCWYNVVMFSVFMFALVWGVVNPPNLTRASGIQTLDGVEGYYEFNNTIPLALAFGYLLSTAIPHATTVALCFKRHYLRQWELDDLVHGRCDEWAVRPNKPGEYYVPKSPVTFIALVRVVLVIACLVYTVAATLNDNGVFIPLDASSSSIRR